MNPAAPSSSRQQQIARAIAAIEHELRALGLWQDTPPPAERLAFTAPFGADTLGFCEWLQWVLVERVRSILTEGGEFPRSSAVGTHAVRELDGYPGAEALIARLAEFDALFDAERCDLDGEADGFRGALAQFEQEALPRHQQALVERLGTPLRLLLETAGMTPRARTVRNLDEFLAGDFYTAVAMMASAPLLALREGLQCIVIAFAPARRDRGVFRRDGELRLVLHPEAQADCRGVGALSRVLEFSVHAGLAAEYRHANARLAHWQELFVQCHGLDVGFVVAWQRFTGDHDALANAWSLHLLAEHGIDALGAALDTLLVVHPELVAPARGWLRELRLDRAAAPSTGAVRRVDEDALLVEIHIAENFTGYWSRSELQERLRRALGGGTR